MNKVQRDSSRIGKKIDTRICFWIFLLALLSIFSNVNSLDGGSKELEDLLSDSSIHNISSQFIGLSSVTVEQIAMDYLKFNYQVINAITNDDEDEMTTLSPPESGSTGISGRSDLNSDSSNNSSPLYYLGSSAGSSFGMGHILAVLKEKIWPVSTAAFESVLREAPDYLTEIYQLLLATMSEDKEFHVNLSIYTNDQIESGKKSVLEGLNATIIPMNFNAGAKSTKENENLAKSNVEQINADVLKNVEDGKFQENYIPVGKRLPTSTKAMLVHTLSYMESWPTAWKRIGKQRFNGRDEVEMMEIEGHFPYLESDRAIEVSIPITKTDSTRVLSLILPRNIEDALNGDLGEAKNGTASWTRIQLPIFNLTFRVPHPGGVGGTHCNFERKENFLNVVDDLTFVSFDPEKVSAVAVTGVEINNVVQYKQELTEALSLSNSRPKRQVPQASSSSTNPKLNATSSASSAEEASTSPSMHHENSTNNKRESKALEKLIKFDKPFTWTIIDDSLFSTPVFSGAIESFPKTTLDLTNTLNQKISNTQTNNPNGDSKQPINENISKVFGLDNSIRYMNCL